MNKLSAPPVNDVILKDLGLSWLHFAAVTVADELDLFEQLKTSLSIRDLAFRLGVAEQGVRSLCRLLNCLEVLDYKNGIVSLNSLARTYLLKESGFYRGAHFRIARERTEHQMLMRGLKGENVATVVLKEGSLQDLWVNGKMPTSPAAQFTALMHSLVFPAALTSVENGELKSVSSLLDLGGGSGAFCIAFVEQYPERSASVFDLPSVCEVARDYVRTYQKERSIQLISGDFFKDEFPKGFDGHLFSNTLHNWKPEQCAELLRKSYQSLPENGALYIYEMLIDEDDSGPLGTASYDLLMYINFKAQQFKLNELKDLLTRAGFRQVSLRPSYSYFSMIEARK